MATALSKETEALVREKISPIVEFFCIDRECRNDREFIDTSKADRKALRKVLNASKGIYSFYNSEYEIIYVGKTKSNLWVEMKSAFNREMEHYKRYLVTHPHERYKPTSDGQVRYIKTRTAHISDAAYYFSAYHVPDDQMIDLVEMMLIRMIPNDLVNVRMEGNGTLRLRQVEE